MIKKLISPLMGISLGVLLVANFAIAQEKTTTTTTTVEATTTKAPAAHRARPVAKPVAAKPAATNTSTSVMSTTTTEVVQPPPPIQKEVVHKVYDEEMLKKMSDSLCTEGFKAYVGQDKKNVCASHAAPPNIAYSCVWDKKGTEAFAPTQQGPCSLDYTDHNGTVIIKKENFANDPPLDYGKQAECCVRPAKGIESASR